MKHNDFAFNQVYFVVYLVWKPVEGVGGLPDIPAHFYGDAQKSIEIFVWLFPKWMGICYYRTHSLKIDHWPVQYPKLQ